MILIGISIIILIIQFCYYIRLLYSSEDSKIEYYREIPSNENPAVVGMMVKNNVDGNDIMATILDLWKKDYLVIENVIIDGEERCVLSETGKDRILSLKDYENYLLDEMFKDSNKIIFDNFVNSPNFEIIFKNIGNMIAKRVDLKSKHKISKKRLFNKINFISNQFAFGFVVFFPFINLIIDNSIISAIISCCINLFFSILVKKLIINKNHDIEELVFGYSITLALIYFGLFLITCFISSYKYEFSNYINLMNMINSCLFIFCLLVGKVEKNNKFNFWDMLFLSFSIASIIFLNLIGIIIGILYFSSQIYFKSPVHVHLKDDSEIEKWNGLKNFLNDFTIINERNMNEIKIWEDYLIYAIAMGVNKKVISEYLKLTNIKLINNNILKQNYIEKL